jgi:RND family efflux transporter MFP subunit
MPTSSQQKNRLLVFASSLLLFGSCLSANAQLPNTEQENQIVQTPLVSVTDQPEDEPLQQKQRIRGQLRSSQFTLLSAGIAAKIVAFPFSHGDRVTKKQLLVRFDCRSQHAEQAVIAAKLKATQVKYEVHKKLSKLNNISQLELNQSEAEVRVMEAEHKKVAALISECKIHAPFDGVITQKNVQAFQYVREGEPLLELVNSDQLEVEMVIPSVWLQWLKNDTPFSLLLDESSQLIEGKVSRIVGSIDPVSQTLRVIGVFPTKENSLLPGMSGEVVFRKP